MVKKSENPEEGKKKRMQNILNKRFQDLPKERAREIQSMGGKASKAAHDRRKTFMEIMKWLGSCSATPQEKANFSNIFPGIPEEEVTKDVMVAASQYHKAITKSDTFAAAFIRDTKGEKPETVISGGVISEKIFIDPEEKKATLDHINEVIKDGNK